MHDDVEAITDVVLKIARQHVASEQSGALSDPDADLGLGSLALVGFIHALEERFDLEFPSDMLVDDTFRTARAAARAVHARQAGGGHLPGGSGRLPAQ